MTDRPEKFTTIASISNTKGWFRNEFLYSSHLFFFRLHI